MNKAALSLPVFIMVFLAAAAAPAFGQWFLDLENGLAVSGYNDGPAPRLSGCRVRPVPPPEATEKNLLPRASRSFL